MAIFGVKDKLPCALHRNGKKAAKSLTNRQTANERITNPMGPQLNETVGWDEKKT